MLDIDQSKAGKLGEGFITPIECLRDKDILSLVLKYRRNIASNYRAVTPDEITTGIPQGKLIASPKIDGEIWFLLLDGPEPVLINPRGRVIGGKIPLLQEAAEFKSRISERTIIAGELFVAKKTGRPRVGDLASLLSQGQTAQVEALGFAPFDLLIGGDHESKMPINDYPTRIATIQRICSGGKRLKPVRSEDVNTSHQIMDFFKEWVDQGKAEGLIVRSADDRVYKIKPAITLDAAIIGYTRRREDTSQVRGILLGLMREDGNFQILGACGNVGDDTARRDLMEQLANSDISSNYRHVSSSGELYQLVKPELVVEVKVTDLQPLDSSENPILRMVLQLSDQKWSSLRNMPGIAILHPAVTRIRHDKKVDTLDVRFSQVAEYCNVTNLTDSVAKQDLPSSEILRREVYTKSAKDLVSVRKLVLFRTNKQHIDSSYPAYVVHWTDYSPGRKDPLQKEVRVAPIEKIATAIANEMIAENIKKGWLIASSSHLTETILESAISDTPISVADTPPIEASSVEVKIDTDEKKAKPKAKRKTTKKGSEPVEEVESGG